MRDVNDVHNSYEAAMIVDPNLSEKDVQKIAQETKELLTKYGASAIADEIIERRALAYPVRKFSEGIYVFIAFAGPTGMPAKVRADLKHREGLLRMAFVRRPVAEPEPATAGAEPGASSV